MQQFYAHLFRKESRFFLTLPLPFREPEGKPALHPRARPVLLLLCLLPLPLFAQSGPQPGTIGGQLVDANTQEPLGFANVVLYSAADSLMGGATTDMDGNFLLEDVPLGDYRLEASYLGYDTRTEQLVLRRGQRFVKFGQMRLEIAGEELDEIVVTADRAVMELGLDRKVFNVEKSVASAGGSAEDLLRQLPSVDVDLDGNVSLRGSGNVRFLINGRPSGIVGTDPATYLKSLPANAVARIEVITNPGAAYDPDGTAGLINIVLKRKREDGFNATANINLGSTPSFDGNLDINWRKGKFNTFAGIAGRYDERWFRGFRQQEGTTEDSIFSRRFDFDGDRLRTSTTLRAGTEYAISKRGLVGIQGSYQLEDGESTNNRETRFFDDGGALSETRFRDEFEPEEETNFEVEAYFSTGFKKEGRKLSASVQYSQNDELEVENYDEIILDPAGDLVESLLQRAPSLEDRTQIITQLDYEQLMGDFKFETGYRSTFQDLTTDAAFGDVDRATNEFFRDDELSNLFNYREDVHAAYATLGGRVDKLIFSTGLRAEQAYTTSTLLEPEFEVFENDYFKLYPSAYLGYELSEATTVQVSYSRRINRPRASALNPFVDRGDPFNLRSGNPFLLPELINSFEANVQQSFGAGTITAGMYYRQKNDLVSRITETLPGGVQLRKRANLDQGRDYGLEVIGTYRPSNVFNLTANVNGFRSEVDGVANEDAVDARGYQVTGNLQASYEISKSLQFQATYFYRSPGVRPQGEIETIQSLDVGLRKELFKKRGALTLRATDIFNTRRYEYTTDLPGLVTRSQFQRQSRIVYLGFQYSLQEIKPQRSGRGGEGGGGDDF